ncbi:MAG: hypothetical protein ACJA2Q_001006 [Pseudohongiellaceae bacterium]|jgi:hypothetical protein
MLQQETFISAYFALCLLCSAGLAGAAVEDSVEIELPDLELLEFLGQFATDDGDWLEPSSLLSDVFEQLLDAATEKETQTDAYIGIENYIETDNEEDDI